MRKDRIKKNFWFKENVNDILISNSKKAGLSQKNYVEELIMNNTIKEKPDDRFYDVMKQMRSISISLNQIARKANSLGFIDVPAYKRESQKWNEFMLEVKKEYLLPK